MSALVGTPVVVSRDGVVHSLASGVLVCGRDLPVAHLQVTTLQAKVHKLPVCNRCWPYSHIDWPGGAA